MYVYSQLNHFAVYWKLIQHCKSTKFQYKIKNWEKIIIFKKSIRITELMYTDWPLVLFGPQNFYKREGLGKTESGRQIKYRCKLRWHYTE